MHRKFNVDNTSTPLSVTSTSYGVEG